MSTSEKQSLQDSLSPHYSLVHAAGAGYKILCSVDNLVGCYLLSKGSTFKWDTCAPHAILMAQQGGIVDYQKALDTVRQNADKTDEELTELIDTCRLVYDKPDREGAEAGEMWSNAGGLIAFRDVKFVVEVLKKII